MFHSYVSFMVIYGGFTLERVFFLIATCMFYVGVPEGNEEFGSHVHENYIHVDVIASPACIRIGP